MSRKILIVDDHHAVCVGISHLLRSYGFSHSSTASTGRQAVSLVKAGGLDVVLLDVRLSREDGLVALQLIREVDPQLPVVMFSAYENPTYVARAAALGANDYILKNGDAAAIGRSVDRAANGDAPLQESLLITIRNAMREELDPAELPSSFPLTAREAQVLRHVALGLSNKEIAASLVISVETVKEHVQNILRKIKASDRTAAAVRAVQSGLVD